MQVQNWARGKSDFWFLKAFFFFKHTLPFIEFSDANAKFYCRLYYAGEFHKMREVILGSSEEDFIRSLSHSSPWQARGGKSGAAFYATEGESVSRQPTAGCLSSPGDLWMTWTEAGWYCPLANRTFCCYVCTSCCVINCKRIYMYKVCN